MWAVFLEICLFLCFNISMISTGNGDGGYTYVLGGKTPIPKNSPVIKVLGALDELNSFLGLCRAELKNEEDIYALIYELQSDLSNIEAIIAGAEKEFGADRVEEIQKNIAEFEEKIPENNAFVVYGNNKTSALLDLSRAVSRRAEREVIENIEEKENRGDIIKYMNRLSDLLYLLARYVEFKESEKKH